MGYRTLTLIPRGAVAAVLATASSLSCGESPVESRLTPGQRIEVGQIVEGAVDADSFSVFSFVAVPSQRYVVLLRAIHGHLLLQVYDSTHQYIAASLETARSQPFVVENPTVPFGTATGGVYRLSLYAIPSGSAPDYRLEVFALNTPPEHVGGTFALGDTVSGETLQAPADLDWFHVRGVAGQEFVAIVEPDDSGRGGTVALTVTDTLTNDFFAFVLASPGAALQTTGRIRIPETRDYRFEFFQVANGIDSTFTGPYRFWSYVIDRTPEHHSSAIAVNAEIRDERIERAGDVDEFTFQATAGTDYNVFVQASGAPVLLEVGPSNGPAVETALGPSDTALFNHPTNLFHVPTAGPYIVRVSGTDPYQVTDTGAYRIYVYAVDPQPEHAAGTIAPGDTVTGEDIGLPGDIDEFTFTGAAGDEFNAFLQARTGSAQTHVQLEVVDQAGAVLQSTQSLGNNTDLLSQPTNRFALPSAGTYRLRVRGVAPSFGDDLNRGSYRLALHRIDPRPETSSATLLFGDSLSSEAIDAPGDVDEFAVQVLDSSGGNLAFQFDGSSQNNSEFRARLLNSASREVIVETGTIQPGTRVATGRVSVPPGRYIVRLEVNDYYHDRRNWLGSYRVWFYKFSLGPESVPGTMTVGDTVSGEAIEPWGDLDRFRFYATRSQHLNLILQGLGPSATGLFQVRVNAPGVPIGTPSVELYIPTASPGFDNHTARIDLPETGWYDLSISGGGFDDRGSYRFTVQDLAIGPEHGNATISAGDSVSEQIDVPGDWDEYTIAGSAGQDFEVFFDGRNQTITGPFAFLRVIDPVTGDTLAGAPGQLVHIAGPFRIPASGQAHVAIFEPGGFARNCLTSCDPFHMVGPFGFKLVAVNLGPENVAATYTVGDTVKGETITPVGDVDQFTASGTPGEHLKPYFRLTQQSPVDSALALEIIDPATGATLWGSGVAWTGTTFGTYGDFTVPAGGTFQVRVRAYRFFEELGFGVGGYEFFVKRGP